MLIPDLVCDRVSPADPLYFSRHFSLFSAHIKKTKRFPLRSSNKLFPSIRRHQSKCFDSRSFCRMYLKASQIRVIKGRMGGLARYATESWSDRLFIWMMGKPTPRPTLESPLKDFIPPPPLPDFIATPKMKITTLPNGLKVASETSHRPAASIGLYLDCGSIYETPKSFGATHLLGLMAFKSTTNRCHLRVLQEIEAIGGHVSSAVSREQINYTLGALKTYVPEMVELLIDSVRNSVFLDCEVNEQLKKARKEIVECSKNPQHLLLEAIHSAGYSGPYGNALFASESVISNLNSAILKEFVAENYTASRIVLAASGVDHDKLLEYAEPLLADLPKVSRPEVPRPFYSGGCFHCDSDSCITHFALAFELPGGWLNEKDAMILTVLQRLMGGGGSFSAGGLGKGMYSRLYLCVLNQYPQIQSFSAFNSVFNHSGLFGIQATTESHFAKKAIDITIKELIAVATPGEVDKVKLDHAKQSTKLDILMTYESKLSMRASEDIGKQVLTYGER